MILGFAAAIILAFVAFALFGIGIFISVVVIVVLLAFYLLFN